MAPYENIFETVYSGNQGFASMVISALEMYAVKGKEKKNSGNIGQRRSREEGEMPGLPLSQAMDTLDFIRFGNYSYSKNCKLKTGITINTDTRLHPDGTPVAGSAGQYAG